MSSNKDRKNFDDPKQQQRAVQNPEQRNRMGEEEERYDTGNTPNTPRSGEKDRDEAARAGQGRGGSKK